MSSERDCIHVWLVEAPGGPTSPGECKLCGEQRLFPNALPESVWAYENAARRRVRSDRGGVLERQSAA